MTCLRAVSSSFLQSEFCGHSDSCDSGCAASNFLRRTCHLERKGRISLFSIFIASISTVVCDVALDGGMFFSSSRVALNKLYNEVSASRSDPSYDPSG